MLTTSSCCAAARATDDPPLACRRRRRTYALAASLRGEFLVREVGRLRHLDDNELVAGGGMAGVAAGRNLAVGLAELARVARLDGEIHDREDLLHGGVEEVGHRQPLVARH